MHPDSTRLNIILMMVCCLSVCAASAIAQPKSHFKFTKTTHDFGKISGEDYGRSYVESEYPVAAFPQTTLFEQKRMIYAPYNTAGHPGPITRTLNIPSGIYPAQLYLRGHVTQPSARTRPAVPGPKTTFSPMTYSLFFFY